MAKFRGIRAGEEYIIEPYLRIPESLLWRTELSSDSKLLFGLILTRTAVTLLNDERGFFFIYLTGNNDPKEVLGMSKNRTYKSLAELEKFGLIERKRAGFGNNVMVFPAHILPEFGNNGNIILPEIGKYEETPYFPKSGTMENEVQNSIQIVQNSGEIVQNSILPENGKYDEKTHTSRNSEVCKSGLHYSQNRDSIIPEFGKYIFNKNTLEKNENKNIKEKSKHIESEQVEKIPSGDSSGRATYFGDLIDEEGNVQEDPLINPNDYDSTGRRIRPRTAEEARRLYWEHQKIRDAVYERDKKRRFG